MQLQQSSSSSSRLPIRAVKEKGFYGILYKEAGRTMTHSAPLSCWSKCITFFYLQLECMYGIVMLFYCDQYLKRPSWCVKKIKTSSKNQILWIISMCGSLIITDCVCQLSNHTFLWSTNIGVKYFPCILYIYIYTYFGILNIRSCKIALWLRKILGFLSIFQTCGIKNMAIDVSPDSLLLQHVIISL